MGAQTSNKQGLHSTVEKTESARQGTEPQPSAAPVPGAHGERERPTPTDIETSFIHDTQRQKRGEDENETRKGG
jgi:hypothetical protein